METLALLIVLQSEPWWQKCESAALDFGYDTGAINLGVDMALNCRYAPLAGRLRSDVEILILGWCAEHPNAPCIELLNAAAMIERGK
jgi:hypothetical protein